MAYIAPNTYVKLYKGVDIDPDYNHTIRFDNAQQQKDWFNNKYGSTQIEFNNQSYQRFERGSLKLQTPIEPVLQCNYMVFGNSSFENKQFYAFVTSVEYSSNNVTIISYEIDVMQTWMFDYTIDDVFIEREHSATDEIGDNLIAEPIGISSEMSVQSETIVPFKYFVGGIITSVKLPSYIGKESLIEWSWGWKIKESKFGSTPCGIPAGLYIYNGFPLSKEDVNSLYGYRNELSTGEVIELFDLQDFRAYRNDAQTLEPQQEDMTLMGLIKTIISGGVTGTNENGGTVTMDEGHIVGAYIYPLLAGSSLFQDNAENSGFEKGMSLSNAIGLPKPIEIKSVNFISRTLTPLEYYVPVNNKLWTSPYSQITISNYNGNNITLYPEDFKNNTYSFKWIATLMQGSTILLSPINHRRLDLDIDSSITLQNFFEPIYSGDAFSSWWNRNKYSVVFGGITSAISSVSGRHTYKPEYTTSYMRKGKPVTRTNRAVHKYDATISAGSLSGVIDAIGTAMDLRNTPPSTYGNTEINDVIMGMKQEGFYIRYMTIKPEVAKTVDNFFTMFGYATNLVKEPNYLDSSKRRPTFNYIKTANMHLSSQRLPADAIEQICDIYNKGVTFWERNAEVGNYSVTNNPQ